MRHAVAASLLCACAACAAPFRAGAPIEIEKHWYRPVYKQDGKTVSPGSLLAGLEGDDAGRARRSVSGGVTLTVVGAVAAGWGLGGAMSGGGDGDVALAAAGAGVLVIGQVLVSSGYDRLERAIRAYNGQLPSASRPMLAPWMAATSARGSRCVVGGLALEF